MTVDPAGVTARRFPLVARPRPPCAPLDIRVRELCALAEAAERTDNQATASTVLNQAALLASDVGLPDLARRWCHRHAEVYLHAQPLTADAARHGLEPLVNLARLHIRAGDGDAASRLLNGLYQAVSSRSDVVLDGQVVPAATLTATTNDHHEIRRWLWTVLLADGVRALTSAGRWRDALAHVGGHKGIGTRMFDGRQVAVLASATAGDTRAALALLAGTRTGDPWEGAVTACLTVLCRPPDRPYDPATAATTLHHYRRLDRGTAPVVFHTRLGLSILDAMPRAACPESRQLATDLIAWVIRTEDGYAARDLLTHLESHGPTTRHAHDLAELVKTCGLDTAALPTTHLADLSTALDTSTQVLRRTLAVHGDDQGEPGERRNTRKPPVSQRDDPPAGRTVLP